jgi:hypothetical protein
MARPKEILIEPKSQKWERKFEDNECIEIWKYDSKKTTKGPVEVIITYKGGYDKTKNWNKMAKEAKDERRTSRQMKKIEAKKTKKKK